MMRKGDHGGEKGQSGKQELGDCSLEWVYERGARTDPNSRSGIPKPKAM